jgi:hypothetical protein
MMSADVVIGHQTYAWVAVAMGIPVMMFAEDMPRHVRLRNGKYQDVPCWDKVNHLFRYPLDLLDFEDTEKALNDCVLSDDGIADWKRRMIGTAMTQDSLFGAVERHL